MISDRVRNTRPAIIDVLLEKHSHVECNFGPGATYFGIRPEVRASICELLANEQNAAELSKYGDVVGSADLCSRWAYVLANAKSDEEMASEVFKDHELMITAGANQGFVNTVLAVCDPGDEVILILPYYFSHLHALTMTGVKPVCVPVDYRDFKPKVTDIAQVITTKSKAVVVVNPGNPSGVEFPQSLMEEITALCKENGLWLILDEAYREFCYQSPGKLVFSPQPDYFIIKLFTMSKAYGLAGWRVGALLYPKAISEHMRKVQDTIPTHASLVSQAVALAALQHDPLCTDGPNFIKQLNDVRQILVTALKPIYEDSPMADAFVTPNAAFYFFLPYVSGEKSTIISPEDDMLAVDFLAEKHSVLVCPGFAFGMPGYLRVSYGTIPPNRAQFAAEKLAHGLAKLFKHREHALGTA